MSKNVYVFIEQRDGVVQKVSLELLGKASTLAKVLGQEVVAVLLGKGIAPIAQTLIGYGANEAIYVDDEILSVYVTEPYTKALTQIIKDRGPEIFLYGATSIGRDLAPRVSARIHTGLTADCTSLEIDGGSNLLLMTRPAFGGNIMATIVCEEHRPQMATVRPGVFEPFVLDLKASGVVTEIKVDFTDADMNIKILEVVKEKKQAKDISDAKILISGGRGIGGAEGFEMLQGLADAMGGEVSSSRACVDAGWILRDRQVGQTGKTVRPECYIACGISGAIQHLAGMEGSDYIIAINKNNTAPIFEASDLGIVGDVNVILPKLTAAVEKYKKEAL
ncbi:MAG: electron transfer flavoprotein subunit alpha/FixB family protein [Clostridiales bacterium]|jgi:electron transfer flavoprotein alpha subunit|nr:electron transfer flavoprotein subunit alpha/FixB family protein [Clostridiales bacterium]